MRWTRWISQVGFLDLDFFFDCCCEEEAAEDDETESDSCETFHPRFSYFDLSKFFEDGHDLEPQSFVNMISISPLGPFFVLKTHIVVE